MGCRKNVKFLGFESISDDEFIQKYEKCCQKLMPKVKVPAIGEKVIIYSNGKGRQEGNDEPLPIVPKGHITNRAGMKKNKNVLIITAEFPSEIV